MCSIKIAPSTVDTGFYLPLVSFHFLHLRLNSIHHYHEYSFELRVSFRKIELSESVYCEDLYAIGYKLYTYIFSILSTIYLPVIYTNNHTVYIHSFHSIHSVIIGINNRYRMDGKQVEISHNGNANILTITH